MKTTIKLFEYRKLVLFTCFAALCACLLGCSKDEEPKVTSVEITSMSPASPSTLSYYKEGANDRVTIDFTYNVVEPDGVRIFIKPISNEEWTGTSYYLPSPIYTGTGNKTVYISLESDDTEVTVDQIVIVIKNAANTVVIKEEFINVDFTFSK